MPTTRMMPVVSWAPVLTYPNQGYGYLGNSHGNYAAAACVQYVSSSQPAGPLPREAHRGGGPPQVGMLSPTAKKDGLDLNIGALKL